MKGLTGKENMALESLHATVLGRSCTSHETVKELPPTALLILLGALCSVRDCVSATDSLGRQGQCSPSSVIATVRDIQQQPSLW